MRILTLIRQGFRRAMSQQTDAGSAHYTCRQLLGAVWHSLASGRFAGENPSPSRGNYYEIFSHGKPMVGPIQSEILPQARYCCRLNLPAAPGPFRLCRLQLAIGAYVLTCKRPPLQYSHLEAPYTPAYHPMRPCRGTICDVSVQFRRLARHHH